MISFEPVPETYNALRENIRLNGFENVTTEAAAAGNQQGTIELVCTKGEELSWTASTLAYSQPGEEAHITVPVVKLDDYVQRNCLAAEAHQDRRRGSGTGSAARRASDAEKDSSGSTGRNPRSGAFAQGTSPSSAPGARLCRHRGADPRARGAVPGRAAQPIAHFRAAFSGDLLVLNSRPRGQPWRGQSLSRRFRWARSRSAKTPCGSWPGPGSWRSGRWRS